MSNDDDYIKLAADAIIGVASLGVFGLNPVDLFPSRKWMTSLHKLLIIILDQCASCPRGYRVRVC